MLRLTRGWPARWPQHALDVLMGLAAVAIALVAPLGHAIWALARSADDGDPWRIALAAALLELLLFAGVAGAVFVAVRLSDTRPRPPGLLRALGFAQVPAALYVLGLLPPLTHFTPLLAIALALRFVTSVQVALRVARLPPSTAVAAVLLGAVAGIIAGFAVASLTYA
ncbi:MAG: hypothetical protein M3470_10565 [Chloroflexota bacterium]|nr:hypothetical protein [Chloroflexota bacterium]